MAYIGAEPIVSATRTITEVTATAGQTVFTANGGYTVGYIDVFLNGAQLQTVDFTATNGTTITLTEAAQVGDVIRLVAWGTFLASNGVAKTGDTMTGALALPSLNVNGGTQNPLGETFTTVVRGSSGGRSTYFDGGTGNQASVWWGGGSTPQFAMDSIPGGGMAFWTHASGAWVNRAQIQSNGQWVSTSPNSSTLLPAFDCRAWVNFNGQGTVAIRASGNVSSITDLATGRYIINFTTAMPDTNYATVFGTGDYNGSWNGGQALGRIGNSTKTASGIHLHLSNNSFSDYDFEEINIAVFR